MRLSEREVHLWFLPLRQEEFSVRELAADEVARAERFRCPLARCTFVQTRLALRLLLGRYLDMAPHAVALGRGAQGKPQLNTGMGALQFNVSHSGQLALIALSREAVGVDLEWQQIDFDWRELLSVCCHPAEQVDFQNVADEVGRTRLLRLWTAKEAYLKGRGEGLGLPLTAIRLQAGAAGWQPSTELPWDDGQKWWLHSLQLPTGYVGCLATPFPSPLIRFQPLINLTSNGQARAFITQTSSHP